MGGCGSRDENGFGTAVLHAVLRIRIVLDGGRKVFRHPLVAAGLGVARGNELDAGLLEGKDSRTDGAQAAEADEADFEAR